MRALKNILFFGILCLLSRNLSAQNNIIDNFESFTGWDIISSEGVKIILSHADGVKGKSIRIDYEFANGTGYGGIQKTIPIELASNYKFSFFVKGQSVNNNFEFKLIDKSGDNVWWVNKMNFEFPNEWEKINIKKKHISFAWGPAENKSLQSVEKIEFIIASYNGGKGTVYIDELEYTVLPDNNFNPIAPVFFSNLNSSDINLLHDYDTSTYWSSGKSDNTEIIIDLGGIREIGGLKIDWMPNQYAGKFSIYTSDNFKQWEEIYSGLKNSSYSSYIPLHELEASFIKIELSKPVDSLSRFAINELLVFPAEYSTDNNRFFINIAKEYPRGYFPRYMNEEASYWTVVGMNNDVKEALINEDGMVEIDKGGFSIEPFLSMDGNLITWNNQSSSQLLEDNYLPIPTVVWDTDGLSFSTTAFSNGVANKNSVLFLTYILKNQSADYKKGNVYLAIRPFQVNPYYQFLNLVGGVSKIKSINYKDSKCSVNDDKYIYTIDMPDGFGATSHDNGDVINYLSEDKLPPEKEIFDKTGFLSAAFKYSYSLKPGEKKIINLAIPFYKIENYSIERKLVEEQFEATKKIWKDKLNHIEYGLPSSADKIVNTIKSNLAYILINRDNNGIQPGSRSYDRSWIRDGALTSSALLKNGIIKEVKDFIEWYAPYQFENGAVPCVVDRRGPDPVPEHDSHGQLIYLIKQYFNYTQDTTFLKSRFSNVIKAVDHIKYLTSLRMTDHYKNGTDSIKSLFGLLPESISHEGYSSKPMHSYWDDFWCMKGLKDAVEIGEILNDEYNTEKFKKLRDQFKINLYNSINLAVKYKGIDYIPGCAELGDFDATSTTIAIYPCNELNNLPEDLLKNTFDKYFEFSISRKNPDTQWINYTPYEVRTIGSYIIMNEIKKAHEQINFFMNDQRPPGWNHWAEVVWKNYRQNDFIGDMPHTWVGSDFINSVRTMFIYENEYDSSLVLGAGLYKEWIDSPKGMFLKNLPTYYGNISYSINKNPHFYDVRIYGSVKLPEGGIVIKNFNENKIPERVEVNGRDLNNFHSDEIRIKEFPASLKIYYE